MLTFIVAVPDFSKVTTPFSRTLSTPAQCDFKAVS